MSTTPTRQPTDEQILREWAQHWPFKRASADLIRQAQRVAAARHRQPEAAPALI